MLGTALSEAGACGKRAACFAAPMLRGTARSDGFACEATPACSAAFTDRNSFSSDCGSSPWVSDFRSAEDTAALPLSSTDVCLAAAWLALSPALDRFEAGCPSAGTAAAFKPTEACLLLPCWRRAAASDPVAGVWAAVPGVLPDICFSLSPSDAFSVDSSCKQ